MGRKNTLKKLRQYARREARDNFKAIEYDLCYRILVKPKPRWIPKFAWRAIVNLVIKKDNATEKEKAGQEEKNDS